MPRNAEIAGVSRVPFRVVRGEFAMRRPRSCKLGETGKKKTFVESVPAAEEEEKGVSGGKFAGATGTATTTQKKAIQRLIDI
jgi:hypothetical protein